MEGGDLPSLHGLGTQVIPLSLEQKFLTVSYLLSKKPMILYCPVAMD